MIRSLHHHREYIFVHDCALRPALSEYQQPIGLPIRKTDARTTGCSILKHHVANTAKVMAIDHIGRNTVAAMLHAFGKPVFVCGRWSSKANSNGTVAISLVRACRSPACLRGVRYLLHGLSSVTEVAPQSRDADRRRSAIQTDLFRRGTVPAFPE